MTAWLYENAKKRIRMYSSNQLDTGPVAFKRAFVTHRNAVTTTVKRTLKTIDCDGREGEEKKEEDLERKRTLCPMSTSAETGKCLYTVYVAGTKSRTVEVLDDCLQQSQNGH